MSEDQPSRTPRRARLLRWARNLAVGLALVLVIFGVVGYFVAPGLIKSTAEKQIAEQTGRRAAIGAIDISPYRLSATIRDFKLYEIDGTTPAAQIDTLLVNVSSSSLFKRALVFDQIKVTHPQLAVTRFEAQRFSFSDIVDKILAKPKTDDEVRFSLNNIEVENGSLQFDDRVTGRKHVVDEVRFGVPFLSNLPYDTDIFVTPNFSARVNGSTIALDGKAQLFAARREATLDVEFSGLDLPAYMDFAPTPLPVKLASGKLDAKLGIRFKAAAKDDQGNATPQTLAISGPIALSSFKLTDTGGREAVALKRLDVDLEDVQPFASVFGIRSIAIAEPVVHVTRRADHSIDLVTLFTPPAPTKTAAAEPAKTAAAAPKLTIASVRVDGGRFDFADETLAPAATTRFDRIAVKVEHVTLNGDSPTSYAVSFATPGDGAIETHGNAVPAKRTASGSVSIKGFQPGAFAGYLATFVAARIGDASVSADADYTIDASGADIAGRIEHINTRIERLRSQLPNEKSSFVAADAIVLGNGAYDFQKHSFTADALTLTAPVVAIARDAKGHMNLQAILVEKKSEASPAKDAPAVVIKPADTQAFTAEIKSLVVERGNISFEDASTRTPVRVRASPFNFKAENVGTSTSSVVPFTLDTVVDQRGKLAVQGKVVVAPLTIDATVNASKLPVGWLAAYAGDRLNVTVETADVDARGSVRVGTPKTKSEALTAAYRGSFGVSRVRVLDRLTSEEFIRLKTLNVANVDFAMPARAAPFSAALGAVTLDDFYARLIVNANGRLNVQDIVSTPGEERSVTNPENVAPTEKPAPTAIDQGKNRTTAAVPPPAGPKGQIHVAGIKITNGRVGITDNFVRPNYSANLAGLTGEVSALDSVDPKPANLKLTGTIDGDGALDVSGRFNPFAASLFVDISAEAKDIELTRLTPYAVKYAGYPIERGKLSTTVKYHIEDGKLEAQNRLFLDQLTFGEKDPSSTANLPVRLAVALLKNSRGEIDINLPVSGSLSDPQFSVGGVIFRALVNLIVRAVTSPFALIGSAFGGGSDGELGYIQFVPGVSDLTPQGKQKLETLAKALADRPQLKLDIIGRFDPATDPEGIKKDHLLDRMKDFKAKEQSKGEARVERGDVQIAAGDEYAKYLAQVYDDTKLPDKPRNLVGLAKTLPPDEMERLLLANMKLDANDPRWLAEARADVVRHYLEDQKVSPSRLFLVTPKLDAEGIKDDGKPNRVDFNLR